MKIQQHSNAHHTVLTLAGEFAGRESDRFRQQALERFDAKARDFVLDLGGVEVVDSEALESLIWLQDRCAEQLGQVRLAHCPEHLEQVLRITRLDPRFDRHASVEQAIQSLG